MSIRARGYGDAQQLRDSPDDSPEGAATAATERKTGAAFVLVAGLIIVITCTNVSAILPDRAVSRRRESGASLARRDPTAHRTTDEPSRSCWRCRSVLGASKSCGKVVQATIPEVALDLCWSGKFRCGDVALVTTLSLRGSRPPRGGAALAR